METLHWREWSMMIDDDVLHRLRWQWVHIMLLCRTLRLSKNVPECETMPSQGGSKPFLSFHAYWRRRWRRGSTARLSNVRDSHPGWFQKVNVPQRETRSSILVLCNAFWKMFSNSFIEIAYMQYVRLSVELDASGLYGGIGSLPFSAEVPTFLLFPHMP